MPVTSATLRACDSLKKGNDYDEKQWKAHAKDAAALEAKFTRVGAS
jgi:hypothetical protein